MEINKNWGNMLDDSQCAPYKRIIIKPEDVRAEAKKNEKENFKFRTFLKCHANEDELDKQFLRLHKEFFADYDCQA